MAAMRHPNIVGFLGVCANPPCVATEYCGRGSLTDVLRGGRNSAAKAKQLDWPRRLNMVRAGWAICEAQFRGRVDAASWHLCAPSDCRLADSSPPTTPAQRCLVAFGLPRPSTLARHLYAWLDSKLSSFP